MSREPFETMPDVMDAKQLAKALQISKAGAYNLLNDPDFPTLRIGGRKLVMKNELVEWLKSRKTEKHENTVKSRKNDKSADSVRRNILRIVWRVSIGKSYHFSNSRAEKNLRKTGGFMRTGLTKREKTTAIYFDEYGSMIEVQTHNTDLKKRLTAFANEYPQCCRQIDDDEQGGLTFGIEKGRLSFRLTAPYSEERKQAASEWAKKNGIGTL